MGERREPSIGVDTLETHPGFDPEAASLMAGRGVPALVVLLECRSPTAPGYRLVLDHLEEVVVGRSTASGVERGARAARIFVGDLQTSRQHLAVRREPAGWRVVDLGSRNGTLVNGRPVQSAALSHGDLIEAGGAMLMFVDRAWTGEARDLDLARRSGTPEVLRTLNLELERRIAQLVRLAGSQVALLVRGETGTGKELIARAIHDRSGRRGPFVAVNCGALPQGLLESELFGHRRGAFSGATEDREGLVRRAHRGTLFLDEIAELPLESQVALLRVLQEGEVRPVGASEDVKVDIRVIAATHQDLRSRIASGRFREDLYGRIAGFDVELPALRDRREDLGMLIATILGRIGPAEAAATPITLSKAAARALLGYPWPLNIRELEQALRSAVTLCDGGEIDLAHLPEAIRGYDPQDAPALDAEDRALCERLIELLRDTEGNVAAVGRAMNRAPNQIRRWCRRLRIDLTRYRQPDSPEATRAMTTASMAREPGES